MRARSVLRIVLILIAVFMPELILGFVGEFLNQFKDAIHQATAR
jgi:multidrug efflux pump subunit AcrB